MSSKIFDKGGNKKGILQRKVFPYRSNAQSPFAFHSPARPSPQLSDPSEFPSLNESAERSSCDLQSASKLLKYSDKVKVQPSSQNDMSASGFLNLSDNTVTKTCDQLSGKAARKKILKPNNKNNADDNHPPNSQMKLSEDPQETDKVQKPSDSKNHPTKQKSLQSFKRIPTNPNSADSLSNPSSKNQPRKPAKPPSKSGEASKVPTGDQQEGSKTAKKKKRKSKVKRQVEFQTGKIMVLTPEVHLKILNQTSALSTQNIRSALTDINDEEEYPELGKAVMPTSQKENIVQRNPANCQKETIIKSADTSEKNIDKVCEESTNIVPDVKSVEKKGKSDNKEKKHIHDPITILFYEMLLEKNKLKDKEPKDEVVVSNHIGIAKIKPKKNLGPHNLLDSSSPAIKRGKEREKPKPKKPSHLKKIILMDRKARREHLLQMKGNNEETNTTNDSEFVQNEDTDEDREACTERSKSLDENDLDNDLSDLSVTEERLVQTPLLQSGNTDSDLQNELISEMDDLNLSKVQKTHDVNELILEMEDLNLCEVQKTHDVNDLSSIPKEDTEAKNFIANATADFTNEISKSDKNKDVSSEVAQSVSATEMQFNVEKSPEFLLSNLIGNVQTKMPEKERAAKILLHTRHFREYCNHLISKDIDDAVFALIDDLARFQDRLHQKDPVKARMKRRLIYGVKEVKKHMKMRKLKGIIIAVDIENVETQGGLNDVLSDIKTIAAENHIPCVFALSRKVLGKVCRKPVPVSCVGVINYEGSEVNFRKMVELQTQSKIDYDEIFNKLVSKLTDEETEALIRAKKEAPESLCSLRIQILNDFFLEPKTEKDESTHLESTEQVPDVINLEA